MAILTEQGRIALATEIHKLPIFMAWGTGLEAWDKMSDHNINGMTADQTALNTPIGVLKVTEKCFVIPEDNAGSVAEIDVDTGRFNRSAESGKTATKHLYMKFQFDFDHAEGEVIREVGVYVGKDLSAENQNKVYFDAAATKALTDKGDLLLVENRRPIHRDEGVRETFEFVITF